MKPTCWLIERGQAEHHAPTVWWVNPNSWTETASAATSFSTRADAEAMIEVRSGLVGDRFGRATEHVFFETGEAMKLLHKDLLTELRAAILAALDERGRSERERALREVMKVADPNYSTVDAAKQTESTAFNIGYQKATREIGRWIEHALSARQADGESAPHVCDQWCQVCEGRADGN